MEAYKSIIGNNKAVSERNDLAKNQIRMNKTKVYNIV